MLIYCPAIIINMNQQQNGKTPVRILFLTHCQLSVPLCASAAQTIEAPQQQTLHFFEKFKHPDYKISSAFRMYSEKEQTKVKETVTRKQRGNYRRYTVAEKQQAVKELIEGGDAKLISQKYCIPRRNLLRWKKNGCQRKDPQSSLGIEIQPLLYRLIDNKTVSTEAQIRAEAKRLSKVAHFQASKGWYAKLIRRYNLWKQQQQKAQGKQEGGKQKGSSLFILLSVSEDSNDQCSLETDKIE